MHKPSNASVKATSAAASTQPLSYRNLPMLLLLARERMMVHFRPTLTAHGLTEQQWRIIRVLNAHGPLESRHIADLCTLSTPSLAGILARMHGAGLVRKSQLAHDRRRVMVTLTPRSVQLIRRISGQLQATYLELEATLGHTTLMNAYAAIDALLDGLDDETAALKKRVAD